MMCCLKSLGDIPKEAYIFQVYCRRKSVWDQVVSYNSARMQFNKEKEPLELGKVTWYSGRIRADTGVARMTWEVWKA